MCPKSHAYSRAGPDLALRCSDSQSKALATLDHDFSSVLLSMNYSTKSEIPYIKNSSSYSKEKVEYLLSTRWRTLISSYKMKRCLPYLLGHLGSLHSQHSSGSSVWAMWLGLGRWSMCRSDILHCQAKPSNILCRCPQPPSSLSVWLWAGALRWGDCTMDGDKIWGKAAWPAKE